MLHRSNSSAGALISTLILCVAASWIHKTAHKANVKFLRRGVVAYCAKEIVTLGKANLAVVVSKLVGPVQAYIKIANGDSLSQRDNPIIFAACIFHCSNAPDIGEGAILSPPLTGVAEEFAL